MKNIAIIIDVEIIRTIIMDARQDVINAQNIFEPKLTSLVY